MAKAPTTTASSATAEHYQPFVSPAAKDVPEFTWSAVVTGTILGIIFSASSMYLVLKVGMTVSASIPIAVLSISLFRAFSAVTRMRGVAAFSEKKWGTTGGAGGSNGDLEGGGGAAASGWGVCGGDLSAASG